MSKYTHLEWLLEAFTSPEEIVVDGITNLILGDIADDPNPRSGGWGEEDEEGMVRANSCWSEEKRNRM